MVHLLKNKVGNQLQSLLLKLSWREASPFQNFETIIQLQQQQQKGDRMCSLDAKFCLAFYMRNKVSVPLQSSLVQLFWSVASHFHNFWTNHPVMTTTATKVRVCLLGAIIQLQQKQNKKVRMCSLGAILCLEEQSQLPTPSLFVQLSWIVASPFHKCWTNHPVTTTMTGCQLGIYLSILCMPLFGNTCHSRHIRVASIHNIYPHNRLHLPPPVGSSARLRRLPQPVLHVSQRLTGVCGCPTRLERLHWACPPHW